MAKILLFCALFSFFNSCGLKKESATHLTICENFLQDLLDKKFERVLNSMDREIADSFSQKEFDEGIRKVSETMRRNFGDAIETKFISSEKTVYEKLPATFLIFKVESELKFGYYFFYINEISGKILLVSEFSNIKQRRS